jgi:N-acetylmuramoyl-L-alanine amidase
MVENADTAYTIVIDAGHGEPDGGAISCTGLPECSYNLEISLRLKDLLNLLGYKTILTRTNASSIYTKGNTIAEKKISDLKERVRIVEATHNPLLISIHQNQFSDGIYSGAVVLYGQQKDSKRIAESLQSKFIQHLNPGSKRRSKPADGIYLMGHISCPAVLVECGFLSNPQEEAKLRSAEYQKKICCILVSSVSEFFVQQTRSAKSKT